MGSNVGVGEVDVKLAKTGWESAFRDHHADLVRLATFLTGDHHAADEVVATVFVRTHDKLVGVADVRAFLRRAVVNGVRDAHRRRVVRMRPMPGAEGSTDPVIEGALIGDQQRRVWRVVQGLPTRQRECVVLRFYEDLTEASIAEILGISRTAVNTNLDRARRRLAAELEGER